MSAYNFNKKIMEIKKILSNIEQKKCKVDILSGKTLFTYIRHSATQWELVGVAPEHSIPDAERTFQNVINKPTELLKFEVFNTRILKDPKTLKIVPKIGSNGRKN